MVTYLSEKDLGRIAVELKCSKGEVIFSEGDTAENFFILNSGSVDLIKTSPDGREYTIRTVERGESFAEAAVFSGDNYPASAIARQKTSLLVIKKQKLLDHIRTNPEMALKIMGGMAKLLIHLNQLVAELTQEPVIVRLVKFLLNESEKQGSKTITLPMQKQELALKLGTIKETLSRNLKKLAAKRLIKVQKNSIILLNPKSLKSLYL